MTPPAPAPAATTHNDGDDAAPRCTLASLRDVLPVLALGVASREPRDGVFLELGAGTASLHSHDGDVAARVTLARPTPAGAGDVTTDRAVVTMRDLKAAVAALEAAGADVADDLHLHITGNRVQLGAGYHGQTITARPSRPDPCRTARGHRPRCATS